MTRRRSPVRPAGPSAAWSAVALAVAVGASTALTARELVERGRRRRPDPLPTPARRAPAPPGARRPGDG
ncbi:hypothetical protein [Pseudolysinimonas kribbensis]|uniref:hypothetical protein n=1 Tax=Pseudolysinimonas kribbensis TaxID=433641 RepID=UPI0031E309DF